MTEIFQVGIEVEETRSTIVTVRLRAKDLKDAWKKAVSAVDDELYSSRGGSLVEDYGRCWETERYDRVGVASDEYPEGTYSTDLDLVVEGEDEEEPKEPNPNQLPLICEDVSCVCCETVLPSYKMTNTGVGWACRDIVECDNRKKKEI